MAPGDLQTHHPPPQLPFLSTGATTSVILHHPPLPITLNLLEIRLIDYPPIHIKEADQGTAKAKEDYSETSTMNPRNNSWTGPKLDLKLNLSPAAEESPNLSPSQSPPSSCVSSDDEGIMLRYVEDDSHEATCSMVLAGCPRCLMYVMLRERDPKCPRCKSGVLLDFRSVAKNRTVAATIATETVTKITSNSSSRPMD